MSKIFSLKPSITLWEYAHQQLVVMQTFYQLMFQIAKKLNTKILLEQDQGDLSELATHSDTDLWQSSNSQAT